MAQITNTTEVGPVGAGPCGEVWARASRGSASVLPRLITSTAALLNEPSTQMVLRAWNRIRGLPLTGRLLFRRSWRSTVVVR